MPIRPGLPHQTAMSYRLSQPASTKFPTEGTRALHLQFGPKQPVPGLQRPTQSGHRSADCQRRFPSNDANIFPCITRPSKLQPKNAAVKRGKRGKHTGPNAPCNPFWMIGQRRRRDFDILKRPAPSAFGIEHVDDHLPGRSFIAAFENTKAHSSTSALLTRLGGTGLGILRQWQRHRSSASNADMTECKCSASRRSTFIKRR